MSVKTHFQASRTALLLSLLYFIPAMTWVVMSDTWLFTEDTLAGTNKFRKIDTIKDSLFVLGIGIMIFIMIRLSNKKLTATKLYYQDLFYRHPNPMWIYDQATLKFLDVNNAAVSHYGYSRSEFLQMTAKDIRPAEDYTEMINYVGKMEKGRAYSHIWKHKKKNGELIMIEATANDVYFKKRACWIISVTDVTERYIKDEEIRKLSLVAENATNSMIITDKNGYIEWVNAPFTLLTGYTLAEVRSKRPQDFLHGPGTDPETRKIILECFKNGLSFNGEILNYRKDGTAFWIRLTISPVFRNNEIENFVTIQTDITRIKEQNTYLRDIAQTASHNFRKPLANILGLANELEHLVGNHYKELEYLKQSAMELDQEIRSIVDKTCILENTYSDI